MAKESKLKTMYLAKDQRIVKPIYRENYDKIDWGKAAGKWVERGGKKIFYPK